MEGNGGMVAVVQGLQHAGLAITLLSQRCEPSGRAVLAEIVGQMSPTQSCHTAEDSAIGTVVVDIPSDTRYRSSYQLAYCQPSGTSPVRLPQYSLQGFQQFRSHTTRSSNEEAFVESLRKYPTSPVRSRSADLIERMLSHTQNKSGAKHPSTSNAKSLPSKEGLKYFRSDEIPTRDTTNDLKTDFGYKRNIDSSPLTTRKRKSRYDAHIGTYDYLKSKHKNIKGSEVRYLTNVKQCIRERLGYVCDEDPEKICAKIRSRYIEHRRQYHTDDVSPTLQKSTDKGNMMQDSSQNALKILPSTSREPKESRVKVNRSVPPFRNSKACFCDRPRPCDCGTQLSESTWNPIVSSECLIPLFNKLKECLSICASDCNETEDIYTAHLRETVLKWLQELPIYTNFSTKDAKIREEIINKLINTIKQLQNDNTYFEKVEDEIKNRLKELPMWRPENKDDKESFENQLAISLLQKIKDMLKIIEKNEFKDEISKLFESIPLSRTDIDKEKIVNEIIDKIEPMTRNQPFSNENYSAVVKSEITRILNDLPINFSSSRTTEPNNIADMLLEKIYALLLKQSQSRQQEAIKKLVFDWVTKIPQIFDDRNIDKEDYALINDLITILSNMSNTQNQHLDNELREMNNKITSWLKSVEEQKKHRLDSNKKNLLITQLISKIIDLQQGQNPIEILNDAVQKWFDDISETLDTNIEDNQTDLHILVKKLLDLQTMQNKENELNNMRQEILKWLQNLQKKQNRYIDSRSEENLANQLISKIKGESNNQNISENDLITQNIWKWLESQPQFEKDNSVQYHDIVMALLDRLQGIKDKDGELPEYDVKVEITKWFEKLAKEQGVQIEPHNQKQLQDSLLSSISPIKRRKIWKKPNNVQEIISKEVCDVINASVIALEENTIKLLKDQIIKAITQDWNANRSLENVATISKLINILNQVTNLPEPEISNLVHTLIERLKILLSVGDTIQNTPLIIDNTTKDKLKSEIEDVLQMLPLKEKQQAVDTIIDILVKNSENFEPDIGFEVNKVLTKANVTESEAQDVTNKILDMPNQIRNKVNDTAEYVSPKTASVDSLRGRKQIFMQRLEREITDLMEKILNESSSFKDTSSEPEKSINNKLKKSPLKTSTPIKSDSGEGMNSENEFEKKPINNKVKDSPLKTSTIIQSDSGEGMNSESQFKNKSVNNQLTFSPLKTSTPIKSNSAKGMSSERCEKKSINNKLTDSPLKTSSPIKADSGEAINSESQFEKMLINNNLKDSSLKTSTPIKSDNGQGMNSESQFEKKSINDKLKNSRLKTSTPVKSDNGQDMNSERQFEKKLINNKLKDSSLKTSTPIKSDNGQGMNSESKFIIEMKDKIRKWLNSLEIDDNIDESFKDDMINDIATDIMDRQRYLQLSKTKRSSNDEMEHLKYQLFKWTSKLPTGIDLTRKIDELKMLIKSLDRLGIPNVIEETYKKQDALAENICSVIWNWLKETPRLKPKSAVDKHTMQDHITDLSKKLSRILSLDPNMQVSNVENECKDEIINSFKKINSNLVQTEKLLERRASELIEYLKRFIDVFKQHAEISGESSSSLQKKDAIKKALLNWCQDLGLKSGKIYDDIKDIVDNLAEDISEYLVSMPMKNRKTFMEDILHSLEKLLLQFHNEDSVHLPEITEGLIETLKSVLNDSKKHNSNVAERSLMQQPIFSKALEVLHEKIQNWCEKLPLYIGNTNKTVEQNKKAKNSLAEKIMKKLRELNFDSEIFNDDDIYEEILKDEIQKILDALPNIKHLEETLSELTESLFKVLQEAKEAMKTEIMRYSYKEKLAEEISKTLSSIGLPLSEETSLETLKDNLADAFISLNYVIDDDELKKIFKDKVYNAVNEFCDDYLNQIPSTPLSAQQLKEELHKAIKKVPVPNEESMRREVEQMRVKDIITHWFKDLPLKEITSKIQENKILSLLARRLHEIENEATVNKDMDVDEIMDNEISKWLEKFKVQFENELSKEASKRNLINKLKAMKRRRKLNESTIRKSVDNANLTRVYCPPSNLSTNDRSHLQGIKDRSLLERTILKPDARKDASVSPAPITMGTQTEEHPDNNILKKKSPNDSNQTIQNLEPPISHTPQVIVKEYYWNSLESPTMESSYSILSYIESPGAQIPATVQQNVKNNTNIKTPKNTPHATTASQTMPLPVSKSIMIQETSKEQINNTRIPTEESMSQEMEQMRIKDIVTDWFKDLTPKDVASHIQKNKIISLLAKKLHEIENEAKLNLDMDVDEIMKNEISKWLEKFKLRFENELNREASKNTLVNKLKSMENGRKLHESTIRKSVDNTNSNKVCNSPPSNLSIDDRAHLQRIKDKSSYVSSVKRTVLKPDDRKDASVSPAPIMIGTQTEELLDNDIFQKDSLNGSNQTIRALELPPSHTPQVIVKEYRWNSHESPTMQRSYSILSYIQSPGAQLPATMQQKAKNNTNINTPKKTPHATTASQTMPLPPSKFIMTQETSNEQINKTRTPNEESVSREMEDVRTKDIVSDWFKDLSSKDIASHMQKNKIISLLAKRLAEIENEAKLNLDIDVDEIINNEISKWLEKFKQQFENELNNKASKINLINQLKAMKNGNLNESSIRQSVDNANSSKVYSPPSNLSTDDRAHLQRIKDKSSLERTGLKPDDRKEASVGPALITISTQTEELLDNDIFTKKPLNGSNQTIRDLEPPTSQTPQVIEKEYNWNSQGSPTMQRSYSMLSNIQSPGAQVPATTQQKAKNNTTINTPKETLYTTTASQTTPLPASKSTMTQESSSRQVNKSQIQNDSIGISNQNLMTASEQLSNETNVEPHTSLYNRDDDLQSNLRKTVEIKSYQLCRGCVTGERHGNLEAETGNKIRQTCPAQQTYTDRNESINRRISSAGHIADQGHLDDQGKINGVCFRRLLCQFPTKDVECPTKRTKRNEPCKCKNTTVNHKNTTKCTIRPQPLCQHSNYFNKSCFNSKKTCPKYWDGFCPYPSYLYFRQD